MTVTDERQRPQIYLDQNVLDILVDNKNSRLEKAILKIGDVFYSNETLAEIHRSGEGAKGFLEVLVRLNARYISTNTNDRGELIDNSATLSDIDVFAKFDEFRVNVRSSDSPENHILDMLFKMFGGLPDVSYGDIASDQMDSVKNTITESMSDPELMKLLPSDQIENAFEALELAKTGLVEGFGEHEERMSVKSLRDEMGIGPKELNNIHGPNVIKQIYDIAVAKAKSLGFEENISIDDLLSISEDKINKERELLPPDKVRSIYMFLNMFGFNPDSKMKQQRRFIAANSDMEHACIAVYADILISRDYAFVRKCAAIYEYLELKRTNIIHLNEEDDGVKFDLYSNDDSYVLRRLSIKNT